MPLLASLRLRYAKTASTCRERRRELDRSSQWVYHVDRSSQNHQIMASKFFLSVRVRKRDCVSKIFLVCPIHVMSSCIERDVSVGDDALEVIEKD